MGGGRRGGSARAMCLDGVAGGGAASLTVDVVGEMNVVDIFVRVVDHDKQFDSLGLRLDRCNVRNADPSVDDPNGRNHNVRFILHAHVVLHVRGVHDVDNRFPVGHFAEVERGKLDF